MNPSQSVYLENKHTQSTTSSSHSLNIEIGVTDKHSINQIIFIKIKYKSSDKIHQTIISTKLNYSLDMTKTENKAK